LKTLILFLTHMFFFGGAMASSGQIHHRIDYIEFAVTDLAKAKEFYGSAFSWKFTDYGTSYAGIQKGNGESGEFGGLSLDSKVTTGGPLVILYSNDLESSRRLVVEAGGTITKEPFSFPGGRRFHFQDPSGNELAAWSDK
jgi:uncharacterized protein